MLALKTQKRNQGPQDNLQQGLLQTILLIIIRGGALKDTALALPQLGHLQPCDLFPPQGLRFRVAGILREWK